MNTCVSNRLFGRTTNNFFKKGVVMMYKSIFNAVGINIFTKHLFTSYFSKGGDMSKSIFSAGSKVRKSAVMFFALIFASVGSGIVCSQDLVGAWVFMEGGSKGKAVDFQNEGRGTGYSNAKGCRSVSGPLGEERGTKCVDGFAYEKVGDVVFLKSVDGSPLMIDYGSNWPKTIETYDEKWSFEILENGKYLKLNGILLKKVEDVDEFRKDQAKQAENSKNIAAYNKAIQNIGVALKNGNIDAVIANCTEALRLIPESTDADIYDLRGSAYYDKKDYDRAIADFTHAIRLNPNKADFYSSRADAWKKKNNYDKAIADISEAIRLNPKDADAYNTRGWWLATGKKDYDRAIADCNEAIRLNAGFANAYDSRGFAYAGKKDYDRAIADYTMALRFDPTITESYLGRGNAYNEKGDYKKAISDFKSVLRISKDREEIGKANDGIGKANEGLERAKSEKRKR